MRMSDWSSDVCSSDLCPRCARPPVYPCYPGTGALKARKSRRSAAGLRHTACRRPANFFPIRIRPSIRATGRYRWKRRGSSDYSGGRRKYVFVRSEEHTSELQSLMRISYAVFCLKKKKKNIITIKRKNNTKTNNLQINIVKHNNMNEIQTTPSTSNQL